MIVRAAWARVRQLGQGVGADRWPRIIQEWLYPPTCLLCGDPGGAGLDLCPACAADLPRIAVACPRCASLVAADAPRLCGRCQIRPPVYSAAHAPLLYDSHNEVGFLVKGLKFARRQACARLLGTLLADSLAGRADPPEALIPVPLHPRRLRKRGFNQALEIARFVSARLEIPLAPDACRRVRDTAAQSSLGSAKQRRLNLREAFRAAPDLAYRHVAVIDDVLTTGTTATELARTLRRAGVEKVEVWTCARAG
ncbi:ComF family protein [Methylomagnum ishizawai]|uniref:ComF family protein n=1 Tax=Methylomagnum ishizawai TaxID=1760988 RepID=UPI001C33879D|nr:ComF family protein [Methylomagnum ishizawai]BBL73369.1 amidophosphoribosyltransferase [Methylomagnum ishizawai]